jgi:hypothetical protein
MLGQYMPGSFFFIVGLILAIWSVIHIAQSSSGPMTKAIWIIVVLFIPYLGFFAWLLFGPRSATRPSLLKKPD